MAILMAETPNEFRDIIFKSAPTTGLYAIERTQPQRAGRHSSVVATTYRLPLVRLCHGRLAWLFDCLDQQIFILFRDTALTNLLPEGENVKTYGGYATSIFVAGWATGGLIFGSVGDRIGRAKTLTITVLLHSVFTGLTALSTCWIDFAMYRFITGLGVGGVFGLAVAPIADTVPDTVAQYRHQFLLQRWSLSGRDRTVHAGPAATETG
jgi:MFS family permease